MANTRGKEIKTPLGRFAFTQQLFKARPPEEGKAPLFGCSILFDKKLDISSLENSVVEVMKEEWGDKAVQMFKDGLIKSPFLDGDGPQGLNKKTSERMAGFAGCRFIRPGSGEAYKPKVVDKNRVDIFAADGFPSGSWGYAILQPYAWTNAKGGKGVSFGINAAQVAKIATGDEILATGGGGTDVNKAFDVIPDEGAAPASTQGGAGAAGLFG